MYRKIPIIAVLVAAAINPSASDGAKVEAEATSPEVNQAAYESLLQTLSELPDGKEAHQRIFAQAYRTAEAANSVAVWKAFIKRFPGDSGSNEYLEAKRRLALLLKQDSPSVAEADRIMDRLERQTVDRLNALGKHVGELNAQLANAPKGPNPALQQAHLAAIDELARLRRDFDSEAQRAERLLKSSSGPGVAASVDRLATMARQAGDAFNTVTTHLAHQGAQLGLDAPSRN